MVSDTVDHVALGLAISCFILAFILFILEIRVYLSTRRKS